MNIPIYLDYMATTPVDPEVAASMATCLESDGVFGNPASINHRYGYEANQCIQQARQQVAALINADPREIVWTSGATESNNLAIKGVAAFYQRQGKHIITMSTEHKSVLDSCRYLETQGFEVTYLEPDCGGRLTLSALQQAIRRDTILISVMQVNNETGVIQDIATIAQLAKQSGAIFHSDVTQSLGRCLLDVSTMRGVLLSFSAHKLYGPKGVGGLFVSRQPRVRLAAQIHGGAQQQGLRAGTLPTHQIVAMGEACRLAKQRFTADREHITRLANRLWQGISALPGIFRNGDDHHRIADCLNIRVDGVESEALLVALRDIAISTGSACNSASPVPSHVLTAMGLSADAANCSIRISLGRFTTEKEVDYAINHIVSTVDQLRHHRSLWDVAGQQALKQRET